MLTDTALEEREAARAEALAAGAEPENELAMTTLAPPGMVSASLQFVMGNLNVVRSVPSLVGGGGVCVCL